MKISLNIKFIDGPFGGAMQFARSLKTHLEKNGFEITNTLIDDDIDLILHIAPFPFLEICSYTYIDAYLYKIKHPKTIITNRINNTDEGRKTYYLNKAFFDSIRYSDHLVFISQWIAEKFPTKKPCTIIPNGGDLILFNKIGKKFWKPGRKMSIVTHHWSANKNKGEDIYHSLDTLLSKSPYSDLFSFTYIGNISAETRATFKNTTFIAPLSGKALADELRHHDIYITAAKNEAAGMHHIEGALSGLPILFIRSGALPEYCKDYGIEFNLANLGEKLIEIRSNFYQFITSLESYKFTADNTNNLYLELFTDLLEAREKNSSKKEPSKMTIVTLAYFFIKNIILKSNRYIIAIQDRLRKIL